MSEDLQIKIAQPDDFEKIGEIFDLYRQFYKKESNVEAVSYTHLTLPTTMWV